MRIIWLIVFLVLGCVHGCTLDADCIQPSWADDVFCRFGQCYALPLIRKCDRDIECVSENNFFGTCNQNTHVCMYSHNTNKPNLREIPISCYHDNDCTAM